MSVSRHPLCINTMNCVPLDDKFHLLLGFIFLVISHAMLVMLILVRRCSPHVDGTLLGYVAIRSIVSHSYSRFL